MPAAAASSASAAWRKRLYLPNYQVREVARYARISVQTVTAWHKADARSGAALSHREEREALSYMQLIEVAVVAAARKAGVSLKRIRDAREYVSRSLESEFPFCEYRFKTDGKELWIDCLDVDGEGGRGKLLGASQNGQLAWNEIIGRLKEFEYEKDGIVTRWHVAGPSSPVVIDPRISFGAPTIRGTPTWVIRGRWDAGESVAEIAEDFGLKASDVRLALRFEDNGGNPKRRTKWVH